MLKVTCRYVRKASALLGTMLIFITPNASIAAPAREAVWPNSGANMATSCQSESEQIAVAFRELRELMLAPGAKIDFAKVSSNPAFLAARQAEDQRRITDWAYICRYKTENEQVRAGTKPTVVFIGDSITENWIHADHTLFSTKMLDRGIGGQTSSQMLLRFYPDVIAIRPAVVHIMAGINDVAGNTGPISDEDFKNNLRAMVDLARANGIKVVLGSIPPAERLAWQPSLRPAARIAALNAWLRMFSHERGLAYADYYTRLADASGGLRADLGNDGVHPNRRGYALMRPIAEQAIAQAMRER